MSRVASGPWWVVGGSLLLAIAVGVGYRAYREAHPGGGPLPRVLLSLKPGEGDAERALAKMAVNEPAAALALAKRELDLYEETSDPRHLSWAEGALAPLFADGVGEPPLEALLLRAVARQRLHDFSGARRDLEALLAREPLHPQAHLSLAVVAMVQGDFDVARAHCAALEGQAHPLASASCLSAADGLTGRAAIAKARLEAALAAGRAPPAESRWAAALLAELSARMGQEDEALVRHRALLAADPSDSHLRLSLADLLLDHGRDEEVRALLSPHAADDGAALRLAIVEARSGSETDAHAAALRERFVSAKAARLSPHPREEARFLLEVEGRAGEAFALAKRNFETQREPADLRLVLEAAVAAKVRAPEAEAFAKQTGLEDAPVRRALAALEGTR